MLRPVRAAFLLVALHDHDVENSFSRLDVLRRSIEHAIVEYGYTQWFSAIAIAARHFVELYIYANSAESHDTITVAEWSNALDLNALHASSESSLFGGVRSNRAGDAVTPHFFLRCLCYHTSME